MGAGGRILAVLEDGTCREASVRYAVELAKRMHGCVEVLILFSSEERRQELADTLEQTLMQVAAEEGVALSTFIRHGNKASELVKHMATHQPIDMMVWGGDEAALGVGRKPRSRHWLGRVRAEIGCPVVAARRKAKTM